MIPGIEIAATTEVVWVRSAAPLHVLASAVVGGDLDATRHVLNMRVAPGYHGRDPASDLTAFARRLGITEPFVGLMTAAPTEAAASATEAADDLRVTAIATVGLGLPAAAGLTLPVAWQPSTINLIVVLDARLERAAAVNGVITATEAKVGALVTGAVLTADGFPATGTMTDAIALAWTGRGPQLPYLGPGTAAGWLLGRAVRRAVGAGIERS